MAWVAAEQYQALIGGVLYRNVPQPIVCNGKSLLSFSRDTQTGQLAVNVQLFEQDQTPIGSVVNNIVTLHNTADYVVLPGLSRSAVIDKQNGRVWCDLKWARGEYGYELSLSCLLFSEFGYPIMLHPDRSKLGTANDDKAPNIMALTLTTHPGSGAVGIGLKNSPLYLLGLAIENFRAGIEITHSKADESK